MNLIIKFAFFTFYIFRVFTYFMLYPLYIFPKDQLYKNQEIIRKILNPSRGVVAYFKNNQEDKLTLNIANVKSIPMEILNVIYDGKVVFKPIKDRFIVRYDIEYTRNENVSYTFDIGIQLEPNRTNKKIKVHVGIYKSNWPFEKKRKRKVREFA